MRRSALALGRQAARINWELIKIMIPVAAAIRLLEMTSILDAVGRAFAPLMTLVGLPGSMALVWVTAITTNLYGGMAAFAALAPAESLTVAQATVICTMMVAAHALPIELRIAQKAGARLRMIGLIRFAGALGFGWVLHTTYALAGVLQGPCRILWRPSEPADLSWGEWAAAQGKMTIGIFAIVLTLLILLKILKRLGVMAALQRAMRPLLRPLGMDEGAAPLTIIGVTMGVTYGGGLIIEEARSGKLSPRSVFFSMALMGLCHSLIEDTALMLALGAHASGVLFGRLILSVAAVSALAAALRRMPEATFNRIFFRLRPEAPPATSEAADD